MALVNRVSRLFKADFHAVLDRIEEPDLLLRQAIREMQEELALDEQRGRACQQEQQQLQRQETDLQDSLRRVEDELDVCFEADKHDLARKLVRRKLELQQRLKLVNQQQELLVQRLADIEVRIDGHRQQLQAMQQKADYLLDSVDEDAGELSQHASGDLGIQDSDVEVAFLKEQQRRAS